MPTVVERVDTLESEMAQRRQADNAQNRRLTELEGFTHAMAQEIDLLASRVAAISPSPEQPPDDGPPPPPSDSGCEEKLAACQAALSQWQKLARLQNLVTMYDEARFAGKQIGWFFPFPGGWNYQDANGDSVAKDRELVVVIEAGLRAVGVL